MPDSLQFAVLSFTSLLAIVNPVGAVPMYVALTGTYLPAQRAGLRRHRRPPPAAVPAGSRRAAGYG